MFEKEDLIPQAHIGHLNNDHKYLQDNEFIHTGYRLYFNSFRKIIRSLFMWHNESINVWSHLLGFLLFLSILVYTLFFISITSEISVFSRSLQTFFIESLYPIPNSVKSHIDSSSFDILLPRALSTSLHPVSRWPLFVFILSAMICLSLSTIYHLFSAHSRKIYSLTSRLDYAGISILISGSFFPPIYYMYFCKESNFQIGLIILYLVGISFFCMMVFIVSLLPAFQKPKFRCLRGSVFLILGLTAIVPCINLCFLNETSQFSNGLWFYLCMALCYIVGVLIYITRFPERFIPGKLDYIGNSHNIWHLFVLGACVFHYLGAVDNYYSRQHLVC